jgi:phosphate/phosphite/phosphonate ABC transporter binding protein
MVAPLRPPSRIGRYVVHERIAVGGMAELFLASEDRGFHGVVRPVVIKRILPQLAGHAQMNRMFLQEAQLIARIQHPNVVAILEYGEDVDGGSPVGGGTPFIAMEYVPGTTLRDLVVRANHLERAVPVAAALHLVMQACAGAHAAHELRDEAGRAVGLVHRDLSPHNMIVDATGHVKVLDFGIAKRTDHDEDLTRPGMLKGKIRYMSPEQCQQGALDRRSDVFALGIVLWELLAGKRPFEQPTELATMQAILNGDRPSLREIRPELPGPILAAIDRALEVELDRRTPSADALRRELAAAANECGLLVSGDAATAFIAAILGDELEARHAKVQRVLHQRENLDDDGTARPAPTLVTAPSVPTRTLTTVAVAMAGRYGLRTLATLAVLLVAAFAARGWVGRSRLQLQGPPIRIGLPPEFDAAVMRTDYEPLLRYLETKVQRPFTAEVASSYVEVINRLATGQLDFGVVTPYVYLGARQTHPELTPIAMQQFDGSSGTDGVLLTADENLEGTPAALTGKTLCLTDRMSSTGYMLPRAWFRKNGIDPDRSMKVLLSGNHFDALRDLAAGRCAVAATYSNAWLVAESAGVHSARLRVIASTGRTPHDAVLAGVGLDPVLQANITRALLNFDPQRDLGVERVGAALHLTGFIPPDESRFDDLRSAIADREHPAAEGRPVRQK